MLAQLWGNEITAASFWSCITEQQYLKRLNAKYVTLDLGVLFVLFFKPHMTLFEHSGLHKLSLSTLLNILKDCPASSLTYMHSCLRGIFSRVKVHPLTSKCGSPGRSPALAVSLILGRMKQSTSRSPLSYFTLQLKKHTVVAGSLGAADLRTDFASCSLLSDIHKINLE